MADLGDDITGLPERKVPVREPGGATPAQSDASPDGFFEKPTWEHAAGGDPDVDRYDPGTDDGPAGTVGAAYEGTVATGGIDDRPDARGFTTFSGNDPNVDSGPGRTSDDPVTGGVKPIDEAGAMVGRRFNRQEDDPIVADDGEPAEEPFTGPVQEPAPEPTEDPIETPAPEPTEDPVETAPLTAPGLEDGPPISPAQQLKEQAMIEDLLSDGPFGRSYYVTAETDEDGVPIDWDGGLDGMG